MAVSQMAPYSHRARVKSSALIMDRTPFGMHPVISVPLVLITSPVTLFPLLPTG